MNTIELFSGTKSFSKVMELHNHKTFTIDSDKTLNPDMCKNGDTCHVSAPRGSRTGTQGLKNAKDRGVIPPQLFEEILSFNQN